MAWNSSLKRNTPFKAKTPLKAKGGFNPSCGFKKKQGEQLSDKTEKSPQKANKGAKTARKNDRSSLETHLDIVFSLYIRLRDAMQGGRTRCISCGTVQSFAEMQCGHYYGRANRATRWDEDNCHSECALDNCSNPNHLEGYTKNLIAKIGRERFDALTVRAHCTRKWSGEELRGLILHYTEEVKRLSKEKGIKVRI